MTKLYLVRHGEVDNPQGIIYGRLPGFGLSASGRQQLEQAAGVLAGEAPFEALYASPMQRAQESADILAARLGLATTTDERIIETGIGQYQGRRFEDLPRPYITEEATHPGIEPAASIRRRFLAWAEDITGRHSGGKVIAVSHRDPIAVILLHWMGKGLEDLPGFPLAPGSVHTVCLGNSTSAVRALG